MTTTTVTRGNSLTAAYLNLLHHCCEVGIRIRKIEWIKGAPELVIINDRHFFRLTEMRELTPGYYMTKTFVRHHKKFLLTAFRCTVKSICASTVSGRFILVPQYPLQPRNSTNGN